MGAVMAHDIDRDEWSALKDRFEEIRNGSPESVPSLEEILDDEIRRRFGRLISRSALDHSPN
jgi:hypothetical protein